MVRGRGSEFGKRWGGSSYRGKSSFTKPGLIRRGEEKDRGGRVIVNLRGGSRKRGGRGKRRTKKGMKRGEKGFPLLQPNSGRKLVDWTSYFGC